jgi:hypothetical protein
LKQLFNFGKASGRKVYRMFFINYQKGFGDLEWWLDVPEASLLNKASNQPFKPLAAQCASDLAAKASTFKRLPAGKSFDASSAAP